MDLKNLFKKIKFETKKRDPQPKMHQAIG